MKVTFLEEAKYELDDAVIPHPNLLPRGEGTL